MYAQHKFSSSIKNLLKPLAREYSLLACVPTGFFPFPHLHRTYTYITYVCIYVRIRQSVHRSFPEMRDLRKWFNED